MPRAKVSAKMIGNYCKLMKGVASGKIVMSRHKKLKSMDCSQVLNKSIVEKKKCTIYEKTILN
jgi:hypothetical protein